MKDNTYDKLKPIIMKWLWFLIAVFAIIVENWEIPYGNTILATASGIAGLIGTYLGVSGDRYWENHTIIENENNDDDYIDEEARG